MTDPELLAAIDETILDGTAAAIGVPWPGPDPSHGRFSAALWVEVDVVGGGS